MFHTQLKIFLTSGLFLFSVLFFSFSQAHAGKKILKVMTYNVNALPWPLKAKKKPLMKFIGHKIKERVEAGNAPDIVVLQEGFVKGVKKHIVKFSGYPYYVRGPKFHEQSKEQAEDCVVIRRPRRAPRYINCGSGKLLNSGLYVMSQHPILESKQRIFGEFCSGADCFANKAIVYTKIQVDGVPLPLNILTTHMNATGKSSGDRELKLSCW